MGSGMHGLPKPEGGGGVAIAATVVTYQFCPGQNSPPPTVADFNQCTPFLKLQGRQHKLLLIPYNRQCSQCVVSVSDGCIV